MEVIHTFPVNLASPGNEPVIHAMQYDGVHKITVQLYSGSTIWTVPEGVTAGIGYTLPNRQSGYYETLIGNTPACTIVQNVVTAVLAPVLTNAVGETRVSVIFSKDGAQLSTFPFRIRVTSGTGQVTHGALPEGTSPFAGKLYYGGNTGFAIPVGLGTGVQIKQQEDGSLVLVSDIETEIKTHNENLGAHDALPLKLIRLTERVDTLLDSDDTTLDQLSEIIAYIKSNKSLIDAITTSKVSVADIVDDLLTNDASKPLSASMGFVLKNFIDLLEHRAFEAIQKKLNADALPGAVAGQIQAFEQSKDLELITSFKLTETVSALTIDRDANGQPFELETAVFELHVGTEGECGEGSSGAAYVYFRNPDKSILQVYSSSGFAYQKVVSGRFRNGGIRAYATTRNHLGLCGGFCGDFESALEPMLMLKNYYYCESPITRILIGAGNGLPANATVSVYGVRSDSNA